MKRPIAYIAATGRGIPSTVLTNADFTKIGIETTDEWIADRAMSTMDAEGVDLASGSSATSTATE